MFSCRSDTFVLIQKDDQLLSIYLARDARKEPQRVGAHYFARNIDLSKKLEQKKLSRHTLHTISCSDVNANMICQMLFAILSE